MGEFAELIRQGKNEEALTLFNGVNEENKSLKIVFYNEIIENMNFCSIELFNGISDFIDSQMAFVAIPRAISAGNLDIVKFLYEKSPEREIDAEMFFALNECADKNRFNVLLYLFDIYGEKVLNPHIIFEIIKQDNLKLFKLIEEKFPIISSNLQAHLTFAAKAASPNMIEYFLSQGALMDGMCQYLIFLAQVEDPKITLQPRFEQASRKINENCVGGPNE